ASWCSSGVRKRPLRLKCIAVGHLSKKKKTGTVAPGRQTVWLVNPALQQAPAGVNEQNLFN
ncbi:hypothetical protein J6590_071855, partial [Homalodisca vitripennis]